LTHWSVPSCTDSLAFTLITDGAASGTPGAKHAQLRPHNPGKSGSSSIATLPGGSAGAKASGSIFSTKQALEENMKPSHLLLAAVLALAAAQAGAQRAPVPIVNHENVLVQAPSGRSATADDVKKAIVAAASATGRKWVIAEQAPGHLVATYQVRTHTVSTDIRYSASQFSVAYKDSINMKYGPGSSGAGVIHPFYNQWVNEFIQAIRTELAKAA
jgi:hypothetical protein